MGNSYTSFSLKKSNLIKIEAWGAAFFLFLLSNPYFTWNNYINNITFILYVIILVKNINIKYKSIAYVLCVLYLFMAIRHGGSFFGMIYIVFTCSLFLVDKEFLVNFFNIYIKIFSLTLIPSLVLYFLITFGGITFSYKLIEPLNEFKQIMYEQYSFLVRPSNKTGLSISRFFGLYDEPGVVGTISTIILFVKKFNLKEKIHIPILIAGIFSFSFFFYIMAIVYIIIYTKIKYKVAIILLFLIILPTLLLNKDLYFLLFRRFEINGGSMIGDNRTTQSFDNWYSGFIHSIDFFWGLGGGSHFKYNLSGASYKDIIVQFGILFFIQYIGTFLYAAYINLKFHKNFILFSLIFLGCIYQRPFITSIFMVTLWIAAIYTFKSESVTKTDKPIIN
jgi:hypothetical protein